MTRTPDKSRLRLIPAVDDILATAELEGLRRQHPTFPWTRLVRGAIARMRDGRLGGLPNDRDAIRRTLVDAIRDDIERLRSGGLRRVINGTGVILHTNLGRAVLGAPLRAAIDEAAKHYLNLEVDLATGTRGHRAEVLSDLIALVAGAEDALVVNNNAAAVYLVVNTYSPPGRVLISRGELVEIGGSFRLPDILQRASLEMIEVGTTNRTYISDYAKVARPGDILLRAHRSNYDIQGFTHETRLGELVALAAERECHVVYDLGSGSLFDFDAAGIEGEERVGDIIADGVDCVTMSGDKLLGGVQAGIIVGSKNFLDRLKHNPLRRAVRVDKITIAALQSLMRTYLFAAEPATEVPMLAQTTTDVDALQERALSIVATLPPALCSAHNIEVVEDAAAIGGGSFAGRELPAVALALRCDSAGDAQDLARRLRCASISVMSRIKDNEIRINLRSVLPHDDGDLRATLFSVLTVEGR